MDPVGTKNGVVVKRLVKDGEKHSKSSDWSNPNASNKDMSSGWNNKFNANEETGGTGDHDGGWNKRKAPGEHQKTPWKTNDSNLDGNPSSGFQDQDGWGTPKPPQDKSSGWNHKSIDNEKDGDGKDQGDSNAPWREDSKRKNYVNRTNKDILRISKDASYDKQSIAGAQAEAWDKQGSGWNRGTSTGSGSMTRDGAETWNQLKAPDGAQSSAWNQTKNSKEGTSNFREATDSWGKAAANSWGKKPLKLNILRRQFLFFPYLFPTTQAKHKTTLGQRKALQSPTVWFLRKRKAKQKKNRPKPQWGFCADPASGRFFTSGGGLRDQSRFFV
ncbi:unnamed protein product, partial [Vitis vinifera]